MIFKEWFEMFYNAYCVDVIAYDCYKDYYYCLLYTSDAADE